jgi:uncharacterized MAPEG superfamily protein
MTIELKLLGWTLVLALVQILLAAYARNAEAGVAYSCGPRDAAGPPVGVMTARLRRAQANLFETLPLFAAAVLIAHTAGLESTMTYWGAWLYFGSRIVYLPLYVFGVPYVRSAVWGIGFGGLAAILLAILS